MRVAAPDAAPAAPHRSLFQRGATARTVRVSSRLATAGMGVPVSAFTGSVMLVVDVTTGRAGGTAAGAATLLGCLGLWWLLPRLVRRTHPTGERRSAERRPVAEPARPARDRPARGRTVRRAPPAARRVPSTPHR
ncbi:DUF6328 family protein [Streptomyces flaveolus]|uniref:DUF6328 family protein n=1 Tax=Streptomyces flaveolus TaxID=67297 RepID=UPI00381B5813